MTPRRYLFPNVIELNYQAGRKLGVNVYLIESKGEFVLIDVGYEESIPDVVDIVRKLDLSLSKCQMLIATHADADHIQGIAKAKELFKTKVAAHPSCIEPMASGDVETTFARIKAQDLDMPMPPCKVDKTLDEGDKIK